MKFLADSMLGSLTRWLRLLGYDARYFRDCNDFELIEEATKEKRILLTGDVELYRLVRKKGLEAILVKERDKAEMLARIADRYSLNLDIDPAKSKCPGCGSSITTVEKNIVKAKVPSSTYEFHDEFWVCTNEECGKVYWYGSHWEKIRKVLLRAKELTELSECKNQN